MAPRYFIKEEKGAFFIYPPFGIDWVAASIDKEEAEKLCAEKNKKLQEETTCTAVIRDKNGKTRECKLQIEYINLADVKAFEQPQEKQEKPKKKSIPRVLRPTVIMPEGDWGIVSHTIYDHALHRLRTLVREGYPCTNYLRGELEEIKKLTRLSDHIKRVNKTYCESMRGVEDDDSPF